MTAPSSTGGRFDFDDGGTYAGTWQDGMSHGHGVCTGPRGCGEYAGAWVEGFETSGVYTWTSGSYFEGQWLQGRRHGLGVENKGHWLYRGEWTQGYKGRYGTRQSTTSGAMYEGTWTSGMQDGYGVETYADGGTFHGQWLRGVRHGYGVRQSVSYDLAARYRTSDITNQQSSAIPASTLTLPGSEREREATLRERDRRLDECRGGFVLLSNTTPLIDDLHSSTGRHQRLLLDKYGKPSLRKTIVKELKLIRQKSTGDMQEQSRSSSRQSGGSVRSTSSATSQSSGATSISTAYSDEGDGASFTSQTDVIMPDHTIERYLGEWKNDRRSGYGICERSDGIRYEGEWMNNRKWGYGVTTLHDGTRIEGKYKNNILVSSGKNTTLFMLRSSKVRDRVDAAVVAAHRAADIAKQKMEIAVARMASARVKAEQAQDAGRRAATDAELARTKARQYSPQSSQPGSNIVANRLQEEELLAEYADESLDILQPLQNSSRPSSATGKRFSDLFRSSKRQPDNASFRQQQQYDQQQQQQYGQQSQQYGLQQQQQQYGQQQQQYNQQKRYDGANSPSGYRVEPPLNAIANQRSYSAPPPQQRFSSNNISGGTLSNDSNWNTNQSRQFDIDGRGGRVGGVSGGGGPYNDKPNSWSNGHGGQNALYTADLGSRDGESLSNWSSGASDTSGWNRNVRQSPLSGGDSIDGWGRDNAGSGGQFVGQGGGSVRGGGSNSTNWSTNAPVQTLSFQAGYQGGSELNARFQQQSLSAGYQSNDRSTQSGYQTMAPQVSSSDYNPYGDVYNSGGSDYGSVARRERRKTLPSIVKEPSATNATTASAGTNNNAMTTTSGSTTTTTSVSSSTKPDATKTTRTPQQPEPEVRRRRQNVDTFVIEDGVRKRVRSVYGGNPAAPGAQGQGVGGPGSGAVKTNVPTIGITSADDLAAGQLPKMYALDSPRMYRKGGDMGSVPDISTAAKQHLEVLPREVVYVMSQQRREELIRERAEEERRRRNQIVLRFGDLKNAEIESLRGSFSLLQKPLIL